jgi:hypothetical protein
MCCRCCLRQVCVHCALCACACVCVGVYTRACSLVECLLTRAAHPHRITYVLHQMLPHAQRQAQAHTFACKHTHTHSLIRTYSLSARASFSLSLSHTHTHTHHHTHVHFYKQLHLSLTLQGRMRMHTMPRVGMLSCLRAGETRWVRNGCFLFCMHLLVCFLNGRCE